MSWRWWKRRPNDAATGTLAMNSSGGLIDLAASAKDPNTLYAATKSGLQISKDGGKSWRAGLVSKREGHAPMPSESAVPAAPAGDPGG